MRWSMSKCGSVTNFVLGVNRVKENKEEDKIEILNSYHLFDLKVEIGKREIISPRLSRKTLTF